MSESYALLYTENSRRIFVVISQEHGAFVLTKSCKGSNCRCLGCCLFTSEIATGEEVDSVLDMTDVRELLPRLSVYKFTNNGNLFLDALDRKRYADYLGPIRIEQLRKLFNRPNAVLLIKPEADGTFTHSFASSTVNQRVISRGCRASPHCPCVGCRIVDMYYTEKPGQLVRVVDFPAARATKDGDAVVPIFVDDSIISAMLNRNPAIRHAFSPGIFDSPLEKMFYELAFLDLHLYPQHPVGKYRLDFAIPDKWIAIELDGHEYHKTRYQRTHDARRDRWLFKQGWHVLRFTGTELHADLDRCIDEICELVGVKRLNGPSLLDKCRSQ